MIYFCPFDCLYFYYIFVLLSFWSFCLLSFNFPAFIFWRVQLVSRRSRLPLCVWILSLLDDSPATKIPHRDHTAPYIQISYIYKYKCHKYKYKYKYHCLPYIVNTAPYIWCAYLVCVYTTPCSTLSQNRSWRHFLDHRMLFNSILFHVNQPGILPNNFHIDLFFFT